MLHIYHMKFIYDHAGWLLLLTCYNVTYILLYIFKSF